jgi:hypothetical protein
VTESAHKWPRLRRWASFGAAVLFGLAVVVATLAALVRREQATNEGSKEEVASTRAVQELLAAQRAELAEEPEWVDKKAGVLSIPVERAMELVVEEVRRDPKRATPAPPSASSRQDAGPSPVAKPSSSAKDAG